MWQWQCISSRIHHRDTENTEPAGEQEKLRGRRERRPLDLSCRLRDLCVSVVKIRLLYEVSLPPYAKRGRVEVEAPMRHLPAPFLLLIAACADKGEDSPAYQPDCAKVLCAADEYCLSTSGGASQDTGDLPECTAAPASCGGTPTCDCLPECTSCTTDGSLVRCSIAYP